MEVLSEVAVKLSPASKNTTKSKVFTTLTSVDDCLSLNCTRVLEDKPSVSVKVPD